MSELIERKRHAKRQAIFDAAARWFADRGYHATRMQDIADDLCLNKAALYYYFDSKEAILVELIRSRVGMALETVTAIVDEPAGDPADKLNRAVTSHLRVFHEDADLYTIFNSEKLRTISAEAAGIVDELGRSYERQWARLVSEGIEAGAFRADLDVTVSVKAVLGMLNATLAWFEPDGRLSLDELADLYVALAAGALS